jgi:hypothetical protein
VMVHCELVTVPCTVNSLVSTSDGWSTRPTRGASR